MCTAHPVRQLEDSWPTRVRQSWSNLIPGSIQIEYDPDELATKITTHLVHKSNSKTYV